METQQDKPNYWLLDRGQSNSSCEGSVRYRLYIFILKLEECKHTLFEQIKKWSYYDS